MSEQSTEQSSRGFRVLPWSLGALGAGALALALMLGFGGGEEDAVRKARPVAATAEAPELPAPRRRPQLVKAVAPGESPSEEALTDVEDESTAAAPASERSVRKDIRELKRQLRGGRSARGAGAGVDGRGDAVAPAGAPQVVAQVIEAGNVIARAPYRYGGGHGAWRDTGYDCSGSISFALAGAGLLDRPLDSSSFMRWGSAGPGRWITIYANPGHAYMQIAGLRFDTSGQGGGGTRWQEGDRGTGGYAVRHPTGL